MRGPFWHEAYDEEAPCGVLVDHRAGSTGCIRLGGGNVSACRRTQRRIGSPDEGGDVADREGGDHNEAEHDRHARQPSPSTRAPTKAERDSSRGERVRQAQERDHDRWHGQRTTQGAALSSLTRITDASHHTSRKRTSMTTSESTRLNTKAPRSASPDSSSSRSVPTRWSIAMAITSSTAAPPATSVSRSIRPTSKTIRLR